MRGKVAELFCFFQNIYLINMIFQPFRLSLLGFSESLRWRVKYCIITALCSIVAHGMNCLWNSLDECVISTMLLLRSKIKI